MVLNPELVRVDNRIIGDDPNEKRLFTVMRDEALRLPNFLDHYRQLGVQRFFIINNCSRDDTCDYVLAQPDCHLFNAASSFLAARAGVNWLNALLAVYGVGHWILYVDADELLVYPQCEDRKLSELCDWMDHGGYQGLYALMLDMYSNKPIANVKYARNDSMITACPWFDRHYSFVLRVSLPFTKKLFPEFEPIGGPRFRLCYPHQNTDQLWPRLVPKLRYRFNKLAKKLRLPCWRGEYPAMQAFKLPLIKWQAANRYITNHRTNFVRLAPITGAVLHFKYLQDFAQRVEAALQTKEHYDGSAEYNRYAELLAADPDLSFMYAGSHRYRDSLQLVELLLIKNDPEWMCSTTKAVA
jgi:hypothetical protein